MQPDRTELIICSKMRVTIFFELEKRASTSSLESITKNLECKFINALRVGYNVAKQGVKTPVLHLVEEVLFEIVHEGDWNTLLVRNSDAFTDLENLLSPWKNVWLKYVVIYASRLLWDTP